MKTKVNEIPLVGPRGRKELIKKINNLEKGTSDSSSDGVSDVRKINLSPDASDILDMMAEKEYLTIEATENNTSVYFESHVDDDDDPVILQIEISTDGTNWTEKSSSYNGTVGTLLATLNAGQKLYLRGNNSTYGCEDEDNDPNGSRIRFLKNCYVYGNVMSLVEGDRALNGEYTTTLDDYTFCQLFTSSFVLSHPTKHLVIPVKSLPAYACCSMFGACQKLKRAPNIPATNIGYKALDSMFTFCGELEIPPKTLYACHNHMFYQCHKLKKSPTYLGEDISSLVFPGCENVCEIVNLGTTISPSGQKDWTTTDYNGNHHCPAETGVIYKSPDVEAWNEIKLPDGWILKDAEIVYE